MPKRVVRYWKKTPTWFRNKYSITLLVFFAYMLFFDQSNVVALLQINQELRELEDNGFHVNADELNRDKE